MRTIEKSARIETQTASGPCYRPVPTIMHVRGLVRKEGGYTPPGKIILRSGCTFFKRSKAEIISRSRREPLNHERQVCMFLLMKDTTLRSSSIGRMFGRYRSTVLYAVKKIEHALETDTKLQHTIVQIRAQYR